MFTVCFFGSSEEVFNEDYKKDVENFIDSLFDLLRNQRVRIITGGYSGIMKQISEIAKLKAEANDIQLEIIGFLYCGFDEDPNKLNDRIIGCQTLGERVQLMIEAGNLFVAMPGKSGTLHEIYHLIQEIKYSNSAKSKVFILHEYWKNELKYCDNLYFINCRDVNEISKILKEINIDPQKNSYDGNGITSKSENIEDEIKMLASQIEEIISGKFSTKYLNILALDVAYSFISPETKHVNGINYSYSCNEYKLILNKFLDEYYSLLRTDQEITQYEELNNTFCNLADSIEPVKKDPLEFYSEKKPAYFYDWCKFLEDGKLGKLSIWLNRKVIVERKPINLSAFLILDIVIPDSIIKKIFIHLERFLLHYLSKIMEEYLRDLFLLKLPIEKYRIVKFNGKNETKFRDIERDLLKPSNREKICETIGKVKSTIYRYCETKEYRAIINSIINKKDALKQKTESKIVFQYFIKIKDCSNYGNFLYGRMLFLVYHIIFRFSRKDSYDLLLAKRTSFFDRATFQRQFHIRGIKIDKIWRGNEKETVVRPDEIIPYISEAEYECLIGICKDLSIPDRAQEIRDARVI